MASSYQVPVPAHAKISVELIRTAVDFYRVGVKSHSTVADALGVTDRIYSMWRKRGKELVDDGIAPEDCATQMDALKCLLYQAIMLARSEGIKRCLERINEEAESNWYANAWILERCHGYGRPPSTVVVGQNDREPLDMSAELILTWDPDQARQAGRGAEQARTAKKDE